MKIENENECVFCNKIKDMELHWGTGVIDFKPLNPVTPGHRLFIPISHVKDFSTNPKISGWVMEEVSKYTRTLDTDYNIITSSGENATQSVFHLHVHVVPRHKGDSLMLPWTNQANPKKEN